MTRLKFREMPSADAKVPHGTPIQLAGSVQVAPCRLPNADGEVAFGALQDFGSRVEVDTLRRSSDPRSGSRSCLVQ
jgi:hypothetical protein